MRRDASSIRSRSEFWSCRVAARLASHSAMVPSAASTCSAAAWSAASAELAASSAATAAASSAEATKRGDSFLGAPSSFVLSAWVSRMVFETAASCGDSRTPPPSSVPSRSRSLSSGRPVALSNGFVPAAPCQTQRCAHCSGSRSSRPRPPPTVSAFRSRWISASAASPRSGSCPERVSVVGALAVPVNCFVIVQVSPPLSNTSVTAGWPG